MEEVILLCDSKFCRLCGESNDHGIYLFSTDENSTNLQELINKYLPVAVERDKKYPKYICPGCYIQLESTKLFLDLILEGQCKLRSLYQKQEKLFQKEMEIEIYTLDHPLYLSDHTLRLQAEGLDKPRRKRGRPAKKVIPEGEDLSTTNKLEENKKLEDEETEEVGIDGRRKRKIRAPARFQGVVQGKELEDIFKKEGVLDDENRTVESMITLIAGNEVTQLPSNKIIIGRTEGQYGEDLGKPVFINCSNKTRIKSKRALLSKNIELGKFVCQICSKSFISKQNFNLHQKSHENEGLNTNILNNEGSSGVNSSSGNIEQATTAIEISSNLDNSNLLEVPSIQNPDSHIADNNVCKKCNKSFPSSETLKIHLAEHSDGRKFPCDICGKVLQHSCSLLYHKQTEHTDQRFVCNTCNRSFKHRQLLKRHQIVHSEERPFVCPICGDTFKTQGNLMNHEAVHTGEKKYECKKCNQKFAHKTSLSLHQRWHEGKKPFTCEYCQKSFSQNGNLLEHKRIHTGEKPFFCAFCGKSFTTSSQIKTHVKRHTGEKPHKCEICGKEFLHKDSYKFHMRRHYKERPYVCEICGNSFTEPWALKKHMLIHTGEKPYKCEICDKSFSDKSNKEKHLRTHNKYPRGSLSTVIDENTISTEKQPNPNDLQLTQLVDQQGNPISITTQDGQTVSVVTSGDDDSNLQGLMPDGRLVPIEIAAVQEKEFDEEIPQEATLDLLETASSDAIAIQDVLQQKEIVQNLNQNFRLLTNNNGEEVCLVTYSLEEDGALTQELVLDTALVKN